MEFYISPNPGEDFKPLNKIASGGEISRIMLALKSILAAVDEIPTLVFDEIDLGVSGRIARAVGRSIHQLSKSHQILCITHLPQIASYGKAHYSVEKYVEDGRTFTRIFLLNKERRVEEIARLMAGEKITETALNSARQLIEEGEGG
jgi:DNA repair protein RecN (Recombination protein N)